MNDVDKQRVRDAFRDAINNRTDLDKEVEGIVVHEANGSERAAVIRDLVEPLAQETGWALVEEYLQSHPDLTLDDSLEAIVSSGGTRIALEF